MDRNEERRFTTLLEAFEEFRELDPDMPIQYATSFLYICRYEGLSIKTLMDLIKLRQSSASRNVSALSEWHKFDKPGLGLVQTFEDPKDRRKKTIELTEKGKKVFAQLSSIMERHEQRVARQEARAS